MSGQTRHPAVPPAGCKIVLCVSAVCAVVDSVLTELVVVARTQCAIVGIVFVATAVATAAFVP